MVRKVRSGQDVVGLFYGHPSVFVHPSHRAIKIAREEGYHAKMLPGISAEDWLFADLGIDPSVNGTTTYEATNLLTRDRPLNPASNLILWQVGVVGNMEFNFTDMQVIPKSSFMSQPQLTCDNDQLTIWDLKDPQIRKKINGCSTFHIPPLAGASLDPSFAQPAAEDRLVKKALSELANHQPGRNYDPLREGTALPEALERLALASKSLQEFQANRKIWVEKNGLGLDEEGKKALITGQGIHAILSLMQTTRRKPVCHTCHHYMEGHKRVGGSPVCPTPDKRVVSPGRSLISPPPSPSPRSGTVSTVPLTDRSSSGPSVQREESLELCRNLKFDRLPTGGYRRRNPNWDSSADIPQTPHAPPNPSRLREPSPAFSVSTVLVDEDGYPLHGLSGNGNESDIEDDRFSDASSEDSIVSDMTSDSSSSTARRRLQGSALGRQPSFVSRIADYARFNKSMVTIFRAKRDEISTIESRARRRGVHTAMMGALPAGMDTSRHHRSPSPSDDSMFVVLGKSATMVKEVAENARGQLGTEDSFNDVMPGTLVRNPRVEGPRMITIPHVILIAVITSCVVVYGLSLISP
ncbi:hypothetical protein EST38_g698 [Candolleomyces aberdarensis]|uniref:MPN domain-containing protein n=1 Tax=Candolleomyces aberdarensis TaxID=2316362 RepID=A0A4Q2E024_9AGAR|nr:hypothetical protein EST38_g698 [Candolleomyces aberdarensis]